MDTNLKSNLKKVAVCVIIGVLGIMSIVMSKGAYATGSTDMYSIKDVMKMQMDRGTLQTALGKESLYPTYYTMRSADNSISGKSIEEGILENEALIWYAENNNLIATDQEVQNYIDNMINEAKEADEYTEFEQAARELGTTYEKIVKGDFEAYRLILTKSKIYENEIGDFDEQYDMEEFEKQKQINMERWASFCSELLNQYRTTEAYNESVNRVSFGINAFRAKSLHERQ